MSLSATIRQQIISSFRAELAEHVQTLNDGLLALEQQRVSGTEREETLGNLFRAAHSLKGAARAVGVNAIEQLAHALEDVLGALQHQKLDQSSGLFNACYQAIDAIQLTQSAYEAGEVTPPSQALKALMALEEFCASAKSSEAFRGRTATPGTAPAAAVQTEPSPATSLPAVPAGPETGKPVTDEKSGNGNRLNDRLVEPKTEAGEPKHPINPDQANLPKAQPGAAKQTEVVSPATALPATMQSVPIQSVATQSVVTQSPAAPPGPAQPVATEPQTAQPAQTAPVIADETIRVNVSKLDALMAQLSELLVTKIHAQQRLNQVRQVQEYMAMWQKEWVSVRSGYSRLARRGQGGGATEPGAHPTTEKRKEVESLLEFVGASQERMREMSAMVNKLSREYNTDTLQMALVIDGLEEEIKRLRMLPLNTITGAFPRMVRDLAESFGKQAILEITGGDVEMDKRVLEQIKDPLIHLLRNAVDHGIEKPERRVQIGKPACGVVSLKAEQSGKDVVITVGDDGVGMDVEGIRRVALHRNIPGSNTMSEAELIDLIYRTGFSTSPIITDISGRGVGLDVVRRNLETLHGRISTEWLPGKGTRFILTIPLSLTSSRGLLVKVSDQPFAIPLNAIERIMQVDPEDVASIGGHDTLSYEGRPLMLVHLGDVLEMPAGSRSHNDDKRLPVVVLSAAERRMAFVVNEFVNEQELVIKGLGRQLSRVGGIAGASVMGSGEIVLILQVADLMKLALRGERRSVLDALQASESAPIPQSRPKPRILVVDDSITTRTLEKNILEAAGYDVQLANDGMEAINLVFSSEVPDLIISDIAMPRLDGFDLTHRLKNESRTNHVPVILVTSLDSPEDKAHGIEVGADAYIVKSSFEQNNLLDTIVQLI